MFLFIQRFIVMVLAFISHEKAVVVVWVPAYSSAVAPITKHTDAANKDLYSLEITAGDVQLHFVIDIESSMLLWCGTSVSLNGHYLQPNAPKTHITTYIPCNELGCSDISDCLTLMKVLLACQ
ncbi:aspartic peptidase A1 family [Artemisia annua]|uniref:Aspartic peptidase A1 family n=1 Tax=Artemisia annua TaxID=35608 RepID=A0A2U1M1L5_ARTAN|nr:aspartic peptidase A1 family [Artemisia annua]